MIRRNLVIAVASAAVAVAGATAGGAQAATTCTHSVPGLLELHMSEHADYAQVHVSAGAIGVRVRGAGSSACGGAPATTASIDTVLVVDDSDNLSTPAVNDGNTVISIDEPASFGPGKTAEADGASEIEFLMDTKAGQDALYAGGSAPQALVAGNDGLSWTSDGDADVLGMPFDVLALFGGAQQDYLSGRGTRGTGAALSTATSLAAYGGEAIDNLYGGDGPSGDYLDGGPGADNLLGYGGADDLEPGAGDDTLQGGGGQDTVIFEDAPAGVRVDLENIQSQDTGEGLDSIVEVENVTGSEYDDVLLGDAAANVFYGLDGNDTFEGRAGADEAHGEAGVDTVSYATAPAPVSIDLSRITQPGDGDRLFSIEGLTGSAFADTLTGNLDGNPIEGGAGADTVSAGGGADRVSVRDGEGDRVSCGADSDSVISDPRTLDALEADCETVDALPEPAGGGDQPGGQPIDDTLSFTLSGARRQRVLRQRGVRVQLRCEAEPCAATASATAVLRRGDGARPIRLKLSSQTASVAGGSTRVVRLPVTRRQRQALRGALLSGQRPLFRVTARARDAAGNVAVRTLQVRSVR